MSTNKKQNMKTATPAEVMADNVALAGDKGFAFKKPTTAASEKIDFGVALMLDVITASVPRQVQLGMQEWLALGGGELDIQIINDSLITKGLWVRPNGQPYKQDLFTVFLHYRAQLKGEAPWGKGENAEICQLATFS